MNKMLLALCFMILILIGFLFVYVLKISDYTLDVYFLMVSYYYSLFYIMIQFIQKPKEER